MRVATRTYKPVRSRHTLASQIPGFILGCMLTWTLMHLAGVPAAALLSGLPPGGLSTSTPASAFLPSKFTGLEYARGKPLMFISFANAAYFEFLLNWYRSLARLDVPLLTVALDEECTRLCREHGLRYGLLNDGGMGGGSFRGNGTKFRGMGALKVALVTALLEEYKVQTLVVSDTDTVWLRDPTPYLEQHPIADWFISTDCTSHKVEEAQTPHNLNPRCGHIPNNSWGRVFNTGVFVLRNRPAVVATLHRWHDFMTDPDHTMHDFGGNHKIVVTDQLALNLVLAKNHEGDLQSVSPDEPRTIWQANNTIRLHPLPVGLFPGGHVAFVQRIPWAVGLEPYVVHATFQRYGTEGKRGRFREFGVWLLDEHSYYSGRFLAYDNNVLQFVEQIAEERGGGLMPPLYKHWLAVGYQQALFHEALAVAKMTDRTVVLPQSWCWCDYHHVPDVLRECIMRGTDMTPGDAFPCPADFVFHIPLFEQQNVSYRMPNFLDLPQVPQSVRTSRVTAKVLRAKPASAELPAVADGAVGGLWLGISEADLMAQLRPATHAAILELRDLSPGLVGGFADQQAAKQFDRLLAALSAENYWCCSGVRMDFQKMSVEYPRPRSFSAPYQPYTPPVLQPMPWCASANVTDENLEYFRYPNHPCQFLLNQTAYKIASQLA